MIIFKLFIIFYSIINILVSLLFFKKNLPIINIFSFVIGSIFMLFSVIGNFTCLKLTLLFLGLLTIQVSAIRNGMFFKKKISLSHHIIRLLISIIILYIYGKQI